MTASTQASPTLVVSSSKFISSQLILRLKSLHLEVFSLSNHQLNSAALARFYSIDYIFQLDPSLKTTEVLVKLAQKLQAKLIIIIQKKDKIVQFTTRLSSLSSPPDIRLISLIDVYGPGMDLNSSTPISQIIKSAVNKLAIPTSDGDLENLHPVYISDCVEALIMSGFSYRSTDQLITIAGPYPISVFNFVHKLRQLLPFPLEISSRSIFARPDRLDISNLKNHPHNLNWRPKVDLETGLSKTLDWIFTKSPRLQPLSLAKPSSKRRPPPAKIAAFSFLILIIVSPLLIFSTSLAYALLNVSAAHNYLLNFNLNQALIASKKASSGFKTSRKTLSFFSAAFKLNFFQEQIFHLEKLIQIGESLSQASLHLSSASINLLDTSQLILGSQTGDPFKLLDSAYADTTRAYELLSLATAQLAEYSPDIGGKYQQLLALTPVLKEKTATLRSLLTVVPQIIGVGDVKKTYLILFQNSAELRPTGGFIGSFALVTFQNGKLLDFFIRDVYAADGQLKGHVEPPLALREQLGEANWYLRDVNWDPDFPSTARQAEWFLEKELGQQVNGTIAVNLYAAQNFIKALGSLRLTDYNETITSDNLFPRAQFHSEIDFFPGSTQKKDFLSSLAQEIFLRLKKLTPEEAFRIIQSIEKSALQSQLLFSFNSDKVSGPFNNLNWDGHLIQKQNCNNVCYQDYLSIREANVGVNKANFFISRKIEHHLTVSEQGSLSSSTTINYVNNSPSESWPAGAYKNYLRFYLPLGSGLKSLTIDGRLVSAQSIDSYQEHNKSVYGFLVLVPIKTKSKLTFSYKLPSSLNLKSPANYSLLVQKQPGTGSDPISFTVTVPPGKQILSKGSSFSTTLDQDRIFSLTLTK